jgi:hypothetical protein
MNLGAQLTVREKPSRHRSLALQLSFLKISESMGNHDSQFVDAGGID